MSYCNPNNKVSLGLVEGISITKSVSFNVEPMVLKIKCISDLKILTAFYQIYENLPTQNLEDP